MSTTDLPGSSLLAGRYRLVERLGAGGMSVVWRGFDEVLGRQVAVKVLPPSSSTDPSFRRRLRAEAQAAARLSHPHITNVYDYGEATTVDGEPVPYVVMELVDGESLAAVLARSRRLPWQAAVQISAEVAAALAAAHARGIVHRDVTPANVMLTPTGAKVVDFGISALIGENDIDPDGSLLGTPAYLAPERLEGGQVSPATDVYAVGLLIYRTLIGQLPWDVGTTTALLRAHQYTEPEPMPPVEGLPAAVSALIARCLEKRPADRPASAELAHILGSLSAGVPGARAYVPEWGDTGEDTTILPTAHSYTNGPGRLGVAPGRGVAAVSATGDAFADASVSFADASMSGAVEDAADPALADASAGVGAASVVNAASVGNAAGISTPASSLAAQQRGGRNSRFGPMAPASPTSAPPAAGAPGFGPPPFGPPPHPYASGPAGLGSGERREGADADPPGPALRPAFGAAAGALAAQPDEPRAPFAAGDLPPAQRQPGGRAGGSQRRRLFVVAGAVALVAGAGAWALGQEAGGSPRGVVANAGPQPTQLAGANKCVVSYAVWSDDGGRFKAAVTIANRDIKAVKNWKLWFLMPGDQVVSGNGKLSLDQQSRAVTVSSSKSLSPQATETMQFTGRYKDSNAAPMVFQLDGQSCETFVSPKPGEPSRPVEHLDNGTVRLGAPPSSRTPTPGISIDPSGVVVPVPVKPGQPQNPGTKPSNDPPGTGGEQPGGGDGTGGDDDEEPPPPLPPSLPEVPPVNNGGDNEPQPSLPPSIAPESPEDVDQDGPPGTVG